MKILPAALAVGIIGLAACSSQTKTASSSTAVGMKAVVINDALPYSTKDGDAWSGLAVDVLKAIQNEQTGDSASTELSY